MKLPETWKVFHVNKSAPAKKTSEREISKRRLIRNNSLKERKLASQQENTPQNEKENLEIIYEDCPEIVETVPNDTDDCSQKTQLSGFDERQEKNLHTDERAVENKDSNTNLEDLTPSDALQKNKGTSVVPKLLIHQNKNRIFEAVKNQFAEIEYSIDTNIEPKSSDNNEENCDFLPTIEEEKDTFQTRNIETDSEDSLDDYLRKDDSLDLIKDKVLTACQKIAEQNSITPSKVEALTSSISSSKDYEEENAEGSQDMADPLMSAKSSANSLTFTPSQMQTNKTPSSEESSKPRSSFYRPLYSSPLSQTSEWKSPINDAPPSTNKPNDITAEEDDHMNSFCNESYLPSLSSSSISVGESSYQPFPETLNSDSIADKSQQTSKRNCNNITTFLSSPSKKHNSYSSIHSRSPIFHDSPESENPESLPSPFAQTYQHPSSSEASADSGDDSLCEGTFSPCKDKKERRKKKKRKIKNHMKETEMQSRNILNDENTILSSSSSECSQLSSSSIFLDPSNASLCSLTSSPISPFRDLTPPLDRSTPISEMKQTSISSIAPSLRLSSSGFSSSSKAKPRTSHSKNTSLLDSPEIQQTNYIKSPTSISANVGSFNIPTTYEMQFLYRDASQLGRHLLLFNIQ
ncbi:uncharacterized protein MONOS_256 [Monocercomonoides exilis]|uniref:uncharacterized protein n=1 Tax=Monocercomonoides exilis TaxID=2049356 RepID=UPI00355ABABB|nr:hypothetical protein MONOS_256 [Monocercomonoides exilis]|eukprot:MONOS_256.1-p1 / transcript=MONOS_256.1 / gene=MONOS_256 / organism=Monocercomonoides_exilis_PA203 / gene_product=unspecified product / transcript_product=unspecified product / location=Mono_scaffold00004:149215-151174(-) / protein_length=634 / sequence_SO=supercontig / SO=protein_coding / is_pseudo=false